MKKIIPTLKKLLGTCFFLLICAALTNCEEKEELPIGKETLIPILRDVHTAEVALQQVGKVQRDSMTNVYFDQVFEIHGVHKDDFRKTIQIVRRNPELLQEIYAEVYRILENENETETSGS